MEVCRDDVIIEIIELFVNTILYVRKVYPSIVFAKKKAYNIPVYTSILPPLNDYIRNVLQVARQLKREKKLHKAELLIYVNNTKYLESYVFDIEDKAFSTNDEYLFKLEEDLRRGLLTMENRVKNMKKLPANCEFKLLLHTTQAAYFDLQTDPKMQDFPFVQASERFQIDKVNTQILPLTTIQETGVQIYAEEYF